MSQVKLMVTRASLQADLPSFSDWETGSADMDKLLLQSSSCRDLDDWHDHHCNNGQQSFVEFEDMADKHEVSSSRPLLNDDSFQTETQDKLHPLEPKKRLESAD